MFQGRLQGRILANVEAFNKDKRIKIIFFNSILLLRSYFDFAIANSRKNYDLFQDLLAEICARLCSLLIGHQLVPFSMRSEKNTLVCSINLK